MSVAAEARRHAVGAEYLDQEARELEALLAKRTRSCGKRRIVGQEGEVVQLEHAGAGSRRRHHIVEALEALDHRLRDRLGICAIA